MRLSSDLRGMTAIGGLTALLSARPPVNRTRLDKVSWIIALWIVLTTTQAFGQGYPSRQVRVIVPFAIGGATDIAARVVSKRLSETWRQSVVVENRPGAGGNIGGDMVARASPDGHTLLMTNGTIVTANQFLYRDMPFNPDKDLVPITMVAIGPQIVVVHPHYPARTLADFIAIAKAKPGSIHFGSAGVGSQTHLLGENVFHAAGIEVLHIPYKGESAALSDLLSGHIHVVTANMPAAITFVRQQRLRALAITSKARSPKLPDVPTVAETLPGFESEGWFGLMAPAGTPKPIVEKIHLDTAAALQAADTRERFDQLGMQPLGTSPSEFASQIRQQAAKWERIIRERGLRAE